MAKFEGSFNHGIYRVPADAAIDQDSSIKLFNAAFFASLQDVLLQPLPSLVVSVDPHAEVAELADEALLPPYLKPLAIGCAAKLLLQLANALSKQ